MAETKITNNELDPSPATRNDPRVTVANKTSAQAITGAAGNVTDLAVSLAASTTYRIELNIPISAVSGTSPTLNLGFTGPASPTLVSLRRTQMTSASAITTSVITSFTTMGASTAVANTHHTIEGTIVNGANAGTLQLQATAAGTTPSITIAAGASIIATKIS